MAMGWEPLNRYRLIGILLSFAGCSAMVMFSDSSSSGGLASVVVGNFLFLFNCTASALYVILSKPALKNYPAICVVAWGFLYAVMFQAAATFILSLSSDAMEFLCVDCSGNPWYAPSNRVEIYWSPKRTPI